MSNSNQRLFDRLIDHNGDIRMFEEGVQVQNRRILARHRKRLRDLLSRDIRSDVSPEVRRFARELDSSLINNLREFSTSQLDFHTDNIHKEVNKFYNTRRPRSRELLAEIAGPQIKGTRSIPKNLSNIATGELVRIQVKVRRGLANGTPPKDIIQDVLKTTKLTEAQARTLTRTSITSTQTAALNKVIEDNPDVIKGYMFTAILDSRTSPICQHHNGKVYDVNDTRFRPPLHWNCRSTMVPVLKSKEELLEIDSGRLKKRKLKDTDGMSMNGVPPARESFSQWLKRQSMSVQTKMLGSEDAANLFRQGKLKVEQFTNSVGQAVSISALRRRAAAITSIFRPRQVNRDVSNIRVNAKTPRSLMTNRTNSDDLRAYIIAEADNYNSPLALTDYKGTSLVGKQASRRRSANEFDERNFVADPFTGEVRSNLRYSPDTTLYQERIDFMRKSSNLTTDQKDFIENFVASLDDKISVNQQTTVVENLRVVFQRYNSDRVSWDDFNSVFSAETRFSVQNTSRLLDTRSRQRAQIHGGFQSAGETPKVQILGRYYSVDELQAGQLRDYRFVNNWENTIGTKLSNRIYLSGRAPLRAYTRKINSRYYDKKKFIDNLLNKVVPFRKKYKEFVKKFKRSPDDSWITKTIRGLSERYRRIVDLEWINVQKIPTPNVLDEKVKKSLNKAMKLIASGQATDYDSLAINIGKMLHKDLGDILPFYKGTLKDYHKEGSEILEYMRQQGLIRVNFLGKTRRGVWDADTGRASGGWGETVSREVQIVDKDLLKLQEANARITIARRYGVTNPRDQLYVRAGKKTFYDARGNDTGIPIISQDKFPDYDPNQIDRDMANMMNHVMNVDYEVDSTFVSFMDDLARFRDPRGNSKYYDSINEFRHEIINRGEAGYGLMSSARYHNMRGRPFKTEVFIDSRGRVYHRGYLTPTGGELVRPFLNSSRAVSMNSNALDELRTQMGALIGPGTEALTQAGRRAIFNRNESKIRELGELLLAKTQRDRRIREFLEHPLIRDLEGAEVAKMSRLSLEYARIHRHVDGNFDNLDRLKTYQTKLMIENDASSSGAQIIALSTRDRPIAQASNVVATTQKNRLYDLVAMDTVNDPEFIRIRALRDANLTWEDLAKGAKAQNMVTFYGAGDATRAANVANKLSGILEKRGFTTITKDDLNIQLRLVDSRIKQAQRLNATSVVDDLQAYRAELIQAVNGNTPISRQLLVHARDVHPDAEEFVQKLYNGRNGLIGPDVFQEVSRIMSKNLSARAPVTDNFITFWKRVARDYVRETQEVDIPWVTFDNKIMVQRYRGKSQERIEFVDPVTGRRVSNIYEGTVENGKLRGNHAYADASIGLGVNGNHSNDAVIVRQFHLWGRKNNVPTATIHDAFFTNIGDADRARDALRTIYADALDGDTIRKTLAEMRRRGLSRETYNELLSEARRLGLIDPPDALMREDILAPIPEGYDWYGIGP